MRAPSFVEVHAALCYEQRAPGDLCYDEPASVTGHS